VYSAGGNGRLIAIYWLVTFTRGRKELSNGVEQKLGNMAWSHYAEQAVAGRAPTHVPLFWLAVARSR